MGVRVGRTHGSMVSRPAGRETKPGSQDKPAHIFKKGLVMKFCFPSKFPTFRKQKDYCDWWSVWINLPIVFCGTESIFCDINKVWKIEASTQIKFERNEFWHSFRITFLGFGLGYARQWGY